MSTTTFNDDNANNNNSTFASQNAQDVMDQNMRKDDSNQPNALDSSDTSESMYDEDSGDPIQTEPDIYTETPIYTTKHVAKRYEKWDYNMVRYYARMFSDFMIDAKGLEHGRVLLSSRDIEVLDKIYFYLYTENLERQQIIELFNKEYNKPPINASLLASEEFAKFFSSDAFKEFLAYDHETFLNQYEERNKKKQDATLMALQEILNEIKVSRSPDADNQQLLLETNEQVKNLEKSIHEKDKQYEQLKENYEHQIQELNQKLETERKKSFFQRLFNK